MGCYKGNIRRKSQRGSTLPLVIMVLAVASITTLSVVSSSSFDVRHSIVDENKTQAYYRARSAIETVVKAVKNEHQDYLAALKTVDDKINAVNQIIVTGVVVPPEYTAAMNAYTAAKTAFILKYNQFNNSVVPLSGSFTHQVNDIKDGSDLPVKVKVERNGNKLVFSSSVQYGSSNVKVVAELDMISNVFSKDITIYEETGTFGEEPTYLFIPNKNPASFTTPIYTFNDLTLGSAVFSNRTKNPKYGGVYIPKNPGPNLDPVIIPPADIIASGDILNPKSMLPFGTNVDAAPYLATKGSLPVTITPDKNGLYGSNVAGVYTITTSNNSRYTVDTTLGDVIIKTNQFIPGNKTIFSIIGDHVFYLYIEEIGYAAGFSAQNTVSFIHINDDPKTMILLQPSATALLGTGSLSEMNNGHLDGFIYAPFSLVSIKNNATVDGAIIGYDVAVEQNCVINYRASTSDDGVPTDPGGRYVFNGNVRTDTRAINKSFFTDPISDVIPENLGGAIWKR